MNQDKIDLLSKKYPKLFQKVYLGISCDDGWFDTLDQLSSKILGITNKYGGEIKFAQIKNKFGLLRIYYDSESVPQEALDHIDSLISAVESMSGSICESCGNPGNMTGKGWMEVLCTSCREKYKQQVDK